MFRVQVLTEGVYQTISRHTTARAAASAARRQSALVAPRVLDQFGVEIVWLR